MVAGTDGHVVKWHGAEFKEREVLFEVGHPIEAVAFSADLSLLKEQVERSSSLEGLAEAFQKRLGVDVGRLWHSTVAKEWDWSVTELDDNTEEIYPSDVSLMPERLLDQMSPQELRDLFFYLEN